MKKNVVGRKMAALLRRVSKRIQEEPGRLDMNRWGEREEEAEHPCGTIGCIAGWAALDGMSIAAIKKIEDGDLYGMMMDGDYKIYEIAQEADVDIYLDVHKLFFLERWPKMYRKAYRTAKSDQGRVRATVRRIEYFIQNGK